MEDITVLINNISGVLQYFIPGYLAITLFEFLASKRMSSSGKIVMSCALSYILLALIVLARFIWPPVAQIPNSTFVNALIAMLLAVVGSALFALVYVRTNVARRAMGAFHKMPSESFWREAIDFENGSNLKLYIKGKEYYVIGHFVSVEENSEDPWLTISAFGKFDALKNAPLKDEPLHLDDSSVKFAIRLSEVEHIEIF